MLSLQCDGVRSFWISDDWIIVGAGGDMGNVTGSFVLS